VSDEMRWFDCASCKKTLAIFLQIFHVNFELKCQHCGAINEYKEDYPLVDLTAPPERD